MLHLHLFYAQLFISRYYNAWIESYSDLDMDTSNDDSLDFEDVSSSSSVSSDEEEDESGEEMDNSVFVESRSNTSLVTQSKPATKNENERENENEEVFEFSSDFSSGNLLIIIIINYYYYYYYYSCLAHGW